MRVFLGLFLGLSLAGAAAACPSHQVTRKPTVVAGGGVTLPQMPVPLPSPGEKEG